jgi:hypothetical protein
MIRKIFGRLDQQNYYPSVCVETMWKSSEQPIFPPIFKPSTFRLQIRSVTSVVTCSHADARKHRKVLGQLRTRPCCILSFNQGAVVCEQLKGCFRQIHRHCRACQFNLSRPVCTLQYVKFGTRLILGLYRPVRHCTLDIFPSLCQNLSLCIKWPRD